MKKPIKKTVYILSAVYQGATIFLAGQCMYYEFLKNYLFWI